MAEQGVNIHTFRHRSDTMLRVAAVQLARLSDHPHPDDGNPVRDLCKFVERDMEAGR